MRSACSISRVGDARAGPTVTSIVGKIGCTPQLSAASWEHVGAAIVTWDRLRSNAFGQSAKGFSANSAGLGPAAFENVASAHRLLGV